MRSVVVIFAAILIIVCFSYILEGLHDCRVDEYTQSFTEITTAAGVTSANITLSQTLYDSSVTNVTSISSNLTGDSPSADNYTSVGRTLLVGGLASDTQRTLSVVYEVSDPDLAGMPIGPLLIMAGLFLIVIILGLFSGAITNIIAEIVSRIRGG